MSLKVKTEDFWSIRALGDVAGVIERLMIELGCDETSSAGAIGRLEDLLSEGKGLVSA